MLPNDALNYASDLVLFADMSGSGSLVDLTRSRSGGGGVFFGSAATSMNSVLGLLPDCDSCTKVADLAESYNLHTPVNGQSVSDKISDAAGGTWDFLAAASIGGATTPMLYTSSSNGVRYVYHLVTLSISNKTA